MKQYSACKWYKKPLRLMRFREGDIPGTRELVHFDQEVTFLRESESVISYQWDGQHFDEIITLNDFYGFLTSSDTDDCLEFMNERKITKEDRLSVVMVTTITDEAIRVLDEKESFGSRLAYENLKDLMLSNPKADEVAKKEGWIPGELVESIDKIVVHSEVTWSSKWDEPNAKQDLIIERLKTEFGIL